MAGSRPFSLRPACGTWFTFLVVTAPIPTKDIPMPKSFGLLSKVTFVTHRIGVYGDWRMNAITLLRGGGGSLYQGRGRARRVHGGADLPTGRRSLPMQFPRKDFA